MKNTDWTSYYKKTPSYTNITRNISRKKIRKIFDKYLKDKDLSFCELGGGNSFILDGQWTEKFFKKYLIIDNNELGLKLAEKKKGKLPVFIEKSDVLGNFSEHEQFDCVISVGLIEHFNKAGTMKAILSHIQLCKTGGIILITFPTPTLLYKFLRFSITSIGKWEFHDERPLEFEEVLSVLENDCNIIEESINWYIGLTQGYIVARKKT